jgi:hypothetical protein
MPNVHDLKKPNVARAQTFIVKTKPWPGRKLLVFKNLNEVIGKIFLT